MTVNRLRGWATEVHDQKPAGLPPEAVVRNLDSWMRAHGLNNSALAEATGYDRTYTFRLLKGERPVTAAFKWNFLAAFGDGPTNEVFYGRKPDHQARPSEASHGTV